MKLVSLLLVFLCVAAFAADDKSDNAKKELEKLQGKWHVTSSKMNGNSISSLDLDDLEITIKGQEMKSKGFTTGSSFFRVGKLTPEFPTRRPVLKTIGSVDLKEVEKPLPFRLSPTNANHIDFGPDANSLPGIYALDGEQLKICISFNPDSGRPKDYTGGRDQFMMTLSRKKPEKAPNKAIDQELERLKGAWTVESGEYDLEKLSDKDLRGFQITFGNEAVKWQEAGSTESLALQIDPVATPAAIDLTLTGPEKTSRKIRGIYHLEKDRLKLILPASFSMPRPKTIQTELGVDAVLVLNRATP